MARIRRWRSSGGILAFSTQEKKLVLDAFAFTANYRADPAARLAKDAEVCFSFSLGRRPG